MTDGKQPDPFAARDGSGLFPQFPDAAAAAQRDDARLWLAAIADSSDDAIIGKDLNGIVISWNKAAEKMFGYSAQQIIGQPVSIIIPPDRMEEEVGIFDQIRRGERVVHFETRRRHRDGGIVPISLSISPIRDTHGRLIGASKIARDCRERDERELRLTAAVAELKKKNEEIEAFVYIVSHDLKAPLVNLQGFSRELELSCAELEQIITNLPASVAVANSLKAIVQDDIVAALQFISANVSKFERLIDSLLRLSRTGQQLYELQTLDIKRLVASTVAASRSVVEQAGTNIVVGELPNAVGDFTAIEQVFGNLLSNAIKYLQPNRPGEIEIAGVVEDSRVHYWVRDNGAGIPESSQARLFQVFQRLHPHLAPGDGMGLAAVKRIVERHGGVVWVESCAGVGSTFHFSLPAVTGGEG